MTRTIRRLERLLDEFEQAAVRAYGWNGKNVSDLEYKRAKAKLIAFIMQRIEGRKKEEKDL